MKIRLLLIVLLCVKGLLSISQIPPDIEQIIASKKERESEFLSVVNHYHKQKEKQKLEAFYFLLRNMGQHYSNGYIWKDEKGNYLEFNELNYPDLKTSIEAFNKMKDTLKIQGQTVKYFDMDTIFSELLIENIDLAFSVWKKPWNKKLSFAEFCEYILPYRVCNEPLQNSRKILYERFSPFMDSLENKGKDFELCTLITEDMKTWFVDTYGLYRRQEELPVLGPLSALHRKQGECLDMVSLATYAMRSVGVPCGIDFAPFWGTSSGRHFWNFTLNEKMEKQIFMGASYSPGHYSIIRELAKVFRMTYEKQPQSLAAIAESKEIPPGFLMSPYIKDVTSEYSKAQNVVCRIEKKRMQEQRFAFLCVFNYSKWKITDWANTECEKDSVDLFYKNLGEGCVYLPVVYVEDKIRPLAFPFVVKADGQIFVFKPNLEQRRKITLHQQDGYLIYRPNKEYTLYYWNDMWIELSTQTPDNNSILTFDQVPQDALLFLRPEYSQGKERIFTIDEKGARHWW